MRVTFELEPADIERFEAALTRAREAAACADEVDVLDAAKYALDNLCAGNVPGYIRQRLVEVQRLILMLEDEAWALAEPERGMVLEGLVYFSDPDDLIPDHVEVIGLLDDAIMLELLLRRLRRVREAYTEFCAYRDTLDGSRHECARALAALRGSLHERMRSPPTARRAAARPAGSC